MEKKNIFRLLKIFEDIEKKDIKFKISFQILQNVYFQKNYTNIVPQKNLLENLGS